MYEPKKLFVRVVEAGSFKKAATQLNIEPSSVSRKISALESRLGVKLLNRSTSKTTPTELGLAYYDRLHRLLEEQEALDEEITRGSQKLSGVLRIGAPVDFGAEFVVPACRDLQLKYPEISLEMSLGTNFDNLLENKLDVAVRIGNLPDSGLIAKKLGDISRVLVASPDYLNANGTPEHPSDLDKHNFILYSLKQRRTDIEFINFPNFPHTKVSSNFLVNSVSAVRKLVIGGAGIHHGPSWFFSDAIKSGEVKLLLENYPLKSFPANAVYSERVYTPKKIRLFTDLMKDVVKDIK